MRLVDDHHVQVPTLLPCHPTTQRSADDPAVDHGLHDDLVPNRDDPGPVAILRVRYPPHR
jgi:hypothetical protein